MTITVEIPEPIGAKIAAAAQKRGDSDDLGGVVAEVLTAFFDTVEPEALEGIKRGLADVAAGREISLEEYAAQQEAERRRRGTL